MAGDACLYYIPRFVAKSESLTRSIPRSFLVTSLADFAAGLDSDLLLCPVRALRLYLLRARSLSTGRHRLFVSPRRPARPSLRTRCRSFWGRSSLLLGRLDLRLDPSGLTKSAACPPLSRSTVTGRFPLSLISHLGLQFGVFLILSSRHSTRI